MGCTHLWCARSATRKAAVAARSTSVTRPRSAPLMIAAPSAVSKRPRHSSPASAVVRDTFSNARSKSPIFVTSCARHTGMVTSAVTHRIDICAVGGGRSSASTLWRALTRRSGARLTRSFSPRICSTHLLHAFSKCVEEMRGGNAWRKCVERAGKGPRIVKICQLRRLATARRHRVATRWNNGR